MITGNYVKFEDGSVAVGESKTAHDKMIGRRLKSDVISAGCFVFSELGGTPQLKPIKLARYQHDHREHNKQEQ